MSVVSLNTLPVGILYRIFDNLDGQTILLSLRYVCKRLHTIADTYKWYQLDFSSISKQNFDFICRLIHPENVISLILSDDNETPGQIRLFLSLFHIDQFIRLHSLTLIRVDESDLNEFLKHIIKYPLTILSIKHREY